MSQTSLSDDLLLRLLVPMFGVLLVTGALSFVLALRFDRVIYDRYLLETARDVAHQVRVVDGRPAIALPRAAVEMLEWDGEDRIHYQVYSRRLGIIAGDPNLPKPAFGERAALPVFDDETLLGEEVRAVSLPVVGLAVDDQVTVRVAETRHERVRTAGNIATAVLLPQLLLIALAVLAIWGGVKAGLAPLERLARAVDARARDDPTPLPIEGVPREAKPLIAAFNGLLARLGFVLVAQQRFIADAAHQLRTPLAALKVQLERARRERDPALHEEALQQLAEAVERSARLSNQLLLLARAEPEVSKGHFARVDLRRLAFDAGSRWVPRALQCGRDLGFAGTENPVWVEGDALLLSELIDNLIDNAINYGGRRITLRVDGGEASPLLSVEDNGPGIPAQERQRVFERFHRIPGSAGNGSGLGLAIVREIARNHQARLFLETPDDGGVRILLLFPMPTPASRSRA
ncbi:swarming motility regulation sensor protein RssA [mine drainage metagenome]|uniref:histidine kinase n=1 Tax=mine drainage metagenome TaxID=410659 RepID=A0A1J5SST7_9ZZZZ